MKWSNLGKRVVPSPPPQCNPIDTETLWNLCIWTSRFKFLENIMMSCCCFPHRRWPTDSNLLQSRQNLKQTKHMQKINNSKYQQFIHYILYVYNINEIMNKYIYIYIYIYIYMYKCVCVCVCVCVLIKYEIILIKYKFYIHKYIYILIELYIYMMCMSMYIYICI